MIFNLHSVDDKIVGEQDIEIKTLRELLDFIEAQDDCLSVVITRCHKLKRDGYKWGGRRNWDLLIYNGYIE